MPAEAYAKEGMGVPAAAALPALPSAAVTYIVQQADASVPNAQALGALATGGLLKFTTTTGVVARAIPGTDYQVPLVAGSDYAVPSVVPNKAAKYIVQQADASVPNAQAMGALATGLVKNTTTTGVQSIAVGDTDYQVPLTFGSGLTRTVNAVANDLITGKAGGQTIAGGTAASENLTLTSTAHATKGKVYLGAALTVWIDGVVGNPRFNIDTTGLTTTVPFKVLNGMTLSGIEVQVTGTAATGYVLRDSAGALQAVFGLAAGAADWIAGTAAGDSVLIAPTAAGKQFLVRIPVANASGLIEIQSAAGLNGARVSLSDGNGLILNYGASHGITVGSSAATVTGPLAISASTSLTTTSLQFAGDPNTGFAYVAGDRFGAVCGGVRIMDINAGGVAVGPNFNFPGGGTQFGVGGNTNIGMRLTTPTRAWDFMVGNAWASGDNHFSIYDASGASKRLAMIGAGGDIIFGNAASATVPDVLVTTAAAGFVRLQTMAGPPTGAAADGDVVIDTTNSKWWARIGGAWKGVVLA